MLDGEVAAREKWGPPLTGGSTDGLFLSLRMPGGTRRRSSTATCDAQVASVRPANLTVIHCVNELGNAVFEATAPGTTIIAVREIRDGREAGSARAAITVLDPLP